jgi:N-acetylornithine carbamoyltransferase
MSAAPQLAGRHLLGSLDLAPDEVHALLAYAAEIKAGRARPALVGKVATFLFFNPSVRTRVSCEAALARFGGTGITLAAGKDTWSFECGEGVVMDAGTQEHVRELAPVLSRMGHLVGIRKAELITVGLEQAGVPVGLDGYSELARDAFLHRFAEFAAVPVVNLESNRWHPLQGLADGLTIRERLREPRGKKYVLMWTWHPKSLPVATPHSQLVAAADLGMRVTVLRPDGFGLDPEVVRAARARAEAQGGSLDETDDVEAALAGAEVVCAKEWGALALYGRPDEERRLKAPLRTRWIVDPEKLERTADAFFMHCLPLRRNVVATDAVLDSRRSAVIDEAENRLWTAAALFGALVPG